MSDQDAGAGEDAGRSVRNEVDGSVVDSVVQAGSIAGGVGNVHLRAKATSGAEIYQAGGDQRIERHHHYLDGVRGVRRTEADSVAAECPYPGLVAFGRAQSRWFFGRDQLIAELTAGLDARMRTGGVQVVVAPSGAGKSSLLHAGLLAQLDAGALPGSRHWPQIVLTPTAHPLPALATQLASLTGAAPTLLASRLATDPGQAVAMLREVLGARAGEENAAGRVVVVVDQFEELFTLCGDDQHRWAFVEVLSQMAGTADGQPVGLVVVGVRADFYAACTNYPLLRRALQDRPLVIGPMSDTELRETIIYPAQDVGLDVEPGLVELLFSELGDTTPAGEDGILRYEAGRLPLLAHALRVTWQQRHGDTLTVAGYRSTGGIHRAMENTAEQVFASLESAGQRVARTLFLRLVAFSDNTEDTKRRIDRAELDNDDPHTGVVLDTLARARLLTVDTDTVELTHEVLIRCWPRLRQWLAEDRDGLRLHRQLADATASWEALNRDPGVLYRGSRLALASDWADRDRTVLTPREREFLDASVATETRERLATQRRTRRLRWLAAVLAVLLVVTVGVTVVALDQRAAALHQQERAEQQQRVTIAQGLVTQADTIRDTDQRTALRLGIAAHQISPTENTRADLFDTLTNTNLVGSLSAGTGNYFKSAAWSPDGHALATGSSDTTVILWDLTNPDQPRRHGDPLPNEALGVDSVVWSPDGRTLAAASEGGEVLLWDVADRDHPHRVGDPLADSYGLGAWSPDGRTLATANDDGTSDGAVALWDLTNPDRPRRHDNPIPEGARLVAWSPDGRAFVTGRSDGTVVLWDVSNLDQPRRHDNLLPNSSGAKVWSPDGRILATGYNSGHGSTAESTGEVLLWDVTDRDRPHRIGNPLPNSFDSMMWSPDSHTLTTISMVGELIRWDLTDPAHPRRHDTPNRYGGVWSPDGNTLASVGTAVILWDFASRDHPHRHDNPISGNLPLAWSPNGHTLATTTNTRSTVTVDARGVPQVIEAGEVTLWNLADRDHPHRHDNPLPDSGKSAAWSPDGRTLATGNGSQPVVLWDVTNPDQPRRRDNPLPGSAQAKVWSPDGHILATGSTDGAVILWDVTNPDQPRRIGNPLRNEEPVPWSPDIPGSQEPVAWSPDGHTLAAISGAHELILWDLADLEHPRRHDNPIRDSRGEVAWSPDGHILAATTNQLDVIVWDITDQDHPRRIGDPLPGGSGPPVAWSPDGHILVTDSRIVEGMTSRGGEVILWDLTSPDRPRRIGNPLPEKPSVWGFVAWSPDGHTLATGSDDGDVILWDFTNFKELRDQTVERACARAGGGLTQEEWSRYVPTLPYRPTCP